jgi:hypothetical protein
LKWPGDPFGHPSFPLKEATMSKTTRFTFGSLLGTAAMAAAFALGAPQEVRALECDETVNYVCCERSDGRISCMKKPD